MKPLFSICLIAKNEEQTLPKFINSENTKKFLSLGGEICLLDTGSTDKTVEIAKAGGLKVEEVGTKFMKSITKEQADAINKMFIVDGEELVVKDGDKFFDFSEARNYATSMATNDIVSFADCDEIFTALNIDKINELIKQGYEQFQYNFVFAHDEYGTEQIKFIQSKMYDRKKVFWTNMVHEVLRGDSKKVTLEEKDFKLEHFQIPSTHRGNYLPGLALDCYLHLDYDRNSHYFARELMWHGRPLSAIKEFKRHIKMNGWYMEKAQSMIFIGDCYGRLNNPELQIEYYNKAIYTDSGRREAFIKLARFYKYKNNPTMTAAYCMAAMEIPWMPFYANDVKYYNEEPHEHLYWAKGWLGDIVSARKHILKALNYQPGNPEYLRDTKFYFEYADNGIPGYMQFEELLWLYNTAKDMNSIIEVGSFKGRSTHALASGCKGKVTAVDHFEGSTLGDGTHGLKGIFEEFTKNTKEFTNLDVIKKSSSEAVQDCENVDMVFIDAGHTYKEVLEDIKTWKPKVKKLLCGHDYCKEWPEVVKAVDEALGKPDGVVKSIWYKYIDK